MGKQKRRFRVRFNLSGQMIDEIRTTTSAAKAWRIVAWAKARELGLAQIPPSWFYLDRRIEPLPEEERHADR